MVTAMRLLSVSGILPAWKTADGPQHYKRDIGDRHTIFTEIRLHFPELSALFHFEIRFDSGLRSLFRSPAVWTEADLLESCFSSLRPHCRI